MTYWREFFARYPFDDLHRYHRPASLVYSAQFPKGGSQAFTAALDLLSPKPKAAKRQVRRARVIRPPKE